MEPGGASQIGPVPLHVVPCNPLAMPPPASSLPSNPAHPIPSQHPVPSHGRQSVANAVERDKKVKKKRRSLPMSYAAAAGSNTLAVSPPTRPSPHSVAPAQHPWNQRLNQEAPGQFFFLPQASCPWSIHTLVPNCLAVFGCNAEVHCEHHLNVCKCIDQSGDRPINFGTYCMSSEPLRADFLISRSRRLCLIVNLEPGPFEVHG